jgi:hypothetical protein
VVRPNRPGEWQLLVAASSKVASQSVAHAVGLSTLGLWTSATKLVCYIQQQQPTDSRKQTLTLSLVVWCRCAVDALQRTAPHARIVIYVRDGVTAEQLVKQADSTFNVKLRGPIEVGSCVLRAGTSIICLTAHLNNTPAGNPEQAPAPPNAGLRTAAAPQGQAVLHRQRFQTKAVAAMTAGLDAAVQHNAVAHQANGPSALAASSGPAVPH